MLAVNPGKTPISLLQEYGTRIGKTPVYDLLKAEGQAHQPNFTFRVSVGEISCTGQGPSKKAAKHKAAEAALKMLKGGLGGPAGLNVMKSISTLNKSKIERCGFIVSFFFFSQPLCSAQSEMKTTGTSQQSECNPVGALQVNADSYQGFILLSLFLRSWWCRKDGVCQSTQSLKSLVQHIAKSSP
uniref:TAR (HIV) RNA binding protein 2 n=1 Tax=Neolamprologus brichardi TaxID=32507 RepID=A0A3Q4GNQ1_NEOBR